MLQLDDIEIAKLNELPLASRIENAKRELLHGDLDGKSRGPHKQDNIRIEILGILSSEIRQARERGASLANISDIIFKETGIPVSVTSIVKYGELFLKGEE